MKYALSVTMAGVPALQEPSRLAQVPLPTLINKVYKINLFVEIGCKTKLLLIYRKIFRWKGCSVFLYSKLILFICNWVELSVDVV